MVVSKNSRVKQSGLSPSLTLSSDVTKTESFNLIEFHFPPPGKRENNDNSIDSMTLNDMS